MDENQSNFEIRNWWRNSIIDMEPGKINLRGHPIDELIGKVSFPQMIWLMVRGELPSEAEAKLLECALVAGVDHGPQAPSIAAARMAATCGVGLNNVIATGVNMLGDVHGGAGEQCAELYFDIANRMKTENIENAVIQGLNEWRKKYGKIIAGFGHRFHKPVDPRAPLLMAKVREAAKNKTVCGVYADIGEMVQKEISKQRGDRPIAMNIDGATAVIFCELGFPPPLSRGLFCLSRSVGILAHGWEQMEMGGRNKGPMPPSFLPIYKPQ
jgi:citrate synthase